MDAPEPHSPIPMMAMLTARMTFLLICAGALSLAACGKDTTSGSTTSPSPTPAAATINESFSSAVTVGGGVFYSFSMAQYGNVAVTLTGISGADLTDGLTLGIGIGR